MSSKAKTKYRKKTRELLIRMVFQMTVSGDFSDMAKDVFLADTSLYIGDVAENMPVGCIFDQAKEEVPDLNYFNFAFRCISDNIEEIDSFLEGASKKWSIERMSNMDLAILRVATAELLYIDKIDDATSISEAVVLARKYSSENSPSFINGILGAISRAGAREARVEN